MVKIGTCGYGFYNPEKGWKKKYKSKLQAFSRDYKLCEINKTFYKLPMTKTAERWRKEAANDFEFTLKAWQAITHPASSPTRRKKKDKLTKTQQENFGSFHSNKEVMVAWEETKKRAEALEARVCVFQAPGSFSRNKRNENNLRRFFTKIDRGGLDLAWEPRGDWNDDPEKIKELCDSLNLIHTVDLMRREPVSAHKTAYIRLHGLNKCEYDYDYDYSDDELKKLAEKLKKLKKNHQTVYCMFNNYEMYKNAARLREIL